MSLDMKNSDLPKKSKKKKAVRPVVSPTPLQTVSPDVLKNPVVLFQHLTQWTCPHGFEPRYYAAFLESLGFTHDDHGNWFREVSAKGVRPTTAFMAHLDTADMEPSLVKHVLREGCLSTNGTSLLGADDRAGMTVLLYLLAHDVPGLYCFFVGEECGRIGSELASSDTERFQGVQRAICFDRKGKESIITHQCGQRTCSDEFANHLAFLFDSCGLPMKADPTGVYTDSLSFASLIPECTNISVGYEKAHSVREIQDMGFLVLLCRAAVEIDWETLPVVRDVTADPFEEDYDAWSQVYDGQSWRYYGEPGYDSLASIADDRETGKKSATTRCSGRKEIDRLIGDITMGHRIDVDDVFELVDRPADQAAYLVLRLLERLQDELF